MKTKSVFRLFAAISLMVLLCSCAAPPKEPPRPSPPKRPSLPPQPEKLPELVVPLIEERKPPARLLSFSVRDADIRQTLLALSKTIGYNIVLDPDVAGRVTVEVVRVTPMEALDALLIPVGLQYKIQNHIIRISRLSRETRIFRLNYIISDRKGDSSFSATISVTGSQNAGQTSGGASGGTITSEDKSDLWGDLEKGLGSIISEEGKFTINRMAGLIVVNDYPANQKIIGEYLEAVEGSIQRQVLIQAKVLDVTLSDEFNLGLNWSAIFNAAGMDMQVALVGGKLFQQPLVPPGSLLTPARAIFQTSLTDDDFSAILRAMAEQGEVRILSTPQISAMNNQKAAMKVVKSDVFFEVSSTTNQLALGTERATDVTTRTIDIGLVLEVTPQISSDGQVMMNIHPIITNQIDEATFEAEDVTITVPVVAVRETHTVVKVPDTRTIILGGLIEEKKDEKQTKVPLLGDLPGLGWFFRQTERTVQKSELVIFLTPTILTGTRIEDLSREELKTLNLEI